VVGQGMVHTVPRPWTGHQAQTRRSREAGTQEVRVPWVPGGDSQLAVEDIADKVIEGRLDYATGVRLVEALTDAVGKRIGLGKRDLLMVLSRKREVHHARR
jgi:hypothetical protein